LHAAKRKALKQVRSAEILEVGGYYGWVMFIKPGWFAGRRQTPLCGLGCWDAQGAALRTQPT
jgi:hypothetical protein